MAATRGVRWWLIFCFGMIFFASCDLLLNKEVTIGNRIVGIVVVMPILFWLMAVVGAAVINIFVIGGRTMNAQVTHSKEIQGDD